MVRARSSVLLLTLAAVGFVAAGAGVVSLPSECGEVGRPNLASATVAVLAVATLLWLIGVAVLLRMKVPRRIRFGLAGAGLVELCAAIAILTYYVHLTGYSNCG